MRNIEIERRVDELAEAHSGQAFADAVRRYADGLDPSAREELERVLLERARAEDDSIERRFEERNWFRRVLRRIEEAERRAARPRDRGDD